LGENFHADLATLVGAMETDGRTDGWTLRCRSVGWLEEAGVKVKVGEGKGAEPPLYLGFSPPT